MAKTEEHVRLFIAVPISDKVRSVIHSIQEYLKGFITDERISWTNTMNIHLTMKFLGETSVSAVGRISKNIEKSVIGLPIFNLDIKNTGVFPSENRPRVLWIGCREGNEHLSIMNKKIDSGLTRLGFKKERKKFIPHLTLGRVRYISAGSLVIKKFMSKIIEPCIVNIDRVNLYQSILKPLGPEYRILETFKL